MSRLNVLRLMELHNSPAQFDIESVSNNGKLNDMGMFNLVRRRFTAGATPYQPLSRPVSAEKSYSHFRSREVIVVTELRCASQPLTVRHHCGRRGTRSSRRRAVARM
jgi:hypothetical protein